MSFQDYADSLSSRIRTYRINKKAVIGAILLLMAIIVVIAVSIASFSDERELVVSSKADLASETSEEAYASDAEDAASKIYVHVAGAVANPGICVLEQGSRVADAISAVGGFAQDASAESVNLARSLEDGEQIIVPSMEQILNAQAAQASDNQSPYSQSGMQEASSGLVNINTASSSELQTISGIGAAKAKKIIDYREKNGRFQSVDDLTKVSGIGEKTLASIRDQICV